MLHASMQKESQLFELGCGTRYAQTGPRPIFDAVLSRCIPLLHLRYRNQRSWLAAPVIGYCLLVIVSRFFTLHSSLFTYSSSSLFTFLIFLYPLFLLNVLYGKRFFRLWVIIMIF